MSTNYTKEERERLTKIAMNFLKGKTRDHRGRTVDDLLKLTPDEMENDHDWIQWAFPISTPSEHNPFAGQLFPGANVYFKCKFPVNDTQEKLFKKFLEFLGIHYWSNKQTDPVRFFTVVDSSYNHTHKRISRLLHHLVLTGKQYLAEAIYHELIALIGVNPNNFHPYTVAMWYAIVYDKTYYLNRHVP